MIFIHRNEILLPLFSLKDAVDEINLLVMEDPVFVLQLISHLPDKFLMPR
jgi:hypothetical protein